MKQKQPHNYGLSGQTPESQYDPFIGGIITGVRNAFDGDYRKQSNEIKFKEKEAQIADTTANANLMNALASSLVNGDGTGGGGGTAGFDMRTIGLLAGGGIALFLVVRWIRNKKRAEQAAIAASMRR